MDSQSPSPSTELSTPSPPTPTAEHAIVVLARIGVSGGMALYASTHGAPWWVAPAVAACIALPAQATAIIELVRGRR